MTTEKTYITSLDKELQQQLETLISMYAVYSSKIMYGDIIIPREHIFDFINRLTIIGITIESIDWWCKATDENKNKYGCPHGYGGPMTKLGWYSEMCHDFNEISEIEHELFLSLEIDFKIETVKNINEKAINLIYNKRTITYADGTFLTFKNNPCLTPGFNLYVPANWRREPKEQSTNH